MANDLINKENLNAFPEFFYTIGILPTSYRISLTYEEQLEEIMKFLRDELIPKFNNNANALGELQERFVELVQYVDNYFNNLDVTQEISDKLDEMAEDGTLTQLIKNYIDPIQEEYETTINGRMDQQDAVLNQQNARIEEINDDLNDSIEVINSKVDSAVSGSPKGTYATISDLETADPDHDYIYVVLADGHWYYYNTTTSEWTDGGAYQASIDNNDIETLKVNSKNYGKYLTLSIKNERGGFSSDNMDTTNTNNNRFRSPILSFTEPTNITLSDNLLFAVYKKNTLTSVTSAEMSQYVSDYLIIPEDNYVYRLLIKNADGTSLENVDLDFSILDDVTNNLFNSVNSLDGYIYNKISIGSFNGTDIRKYASSTSRARTQCLMFNTKTEVKLNNDNYQFLYYKMNITTNEVINTSFAREFTIEKDTENIYRFLIKKNDSSTISAAELAEIKNNLIYIEKVIEVNIPDTSTTNYKRLIQSNTHSSLLNSNLFKKAFKEFPNGFVSVGFDDGNIDVEDAIEYCHTNNVPCYIALIPGREEGTGVTQMVQNMLTYGGELCSHNSTVITPDVQADEDQMFDLFVNTKFYLEDKFSTKVHGIIMAGGTGQNTEDKTDRKSTRLNSSH